MKAFSESNPNIKIMPCSDQVEINLQNGLKFFTMGAMMNIRNCNLHGDKEQMNVGEVLALICFASFYSKLLIKDTII